MSLNVAISRPGLTRKGGNVLFNDALNTFYLRLYGVRYMVKDHSDSERGNPLLPHGLLFPISNEMAYFFLRLADRITHTAVCVTPVVQHWLERETAQWVHHERTLLPRSYISLRGLSRRYGLGGGGERERKMFYLTTHSTHFIYGYMTSDIWLRTIQIAREENRCRHMGYSYR